MKQNNSLDRRHVEAIWQRIEQKTKPLGALGQLEHLAAQLALIQSQGKLQPASKIELKSPTLVIFAGDHGIADEGVSIAPSVVTQQMVANFLAGGAAANCFCRTSQVDMRVVDCGMLAPVESDNPCLTLHRLGCGTANFANQPAMKIEQQTEGLLLGEQLVDELVDAGCNLLMFGEMGIGNTSSAAAILLALSQLTPEQCVGRGTGIDDQQYQRKLQLVTDAVKRCQGMTPQQVLAEVGGFEIVQTVGAMLGAYRRQVPVLVDGFIITVAAYVATLIEPGVRDYLIFAHRSEEAAHGLVLQMLEARPLLDLSLRLGEGTGSLLAMPLLHAAAEFYNNMASFADAGVTV
ncbi:nicotinate-nucleotide--dimethylbenzimidazole phosphoribosyltransferase [Vibrio sp.]|uniref:nicotinate-nucleotide--dimethylbenzimidazole phosphoribosyltransferase n=1 Tax=Vibrio sp. TaxID=678 RepID=UPI003D0C8AB5